MRIRGILSITTFLAGIALIIAAVALGQGEVFLFLVFPGVVSTSPLALLGITLIFLSFVIGFLSFSYAPPAEVLPGEVPPGYKEREAPTPVETERRRSFGGIVFLGPIPIVFGSSTRTTLVMLILALAITIVMAVLFLVLLR